MEIENPVWILNSDFLYCVIPVINENGGLSQIIYIHNGNYVKLTLDLILYEYVISENISFNNGRD